MKTILVLTVLAILAIPAQAHATTTSSRPPGGRIVIPPKSQQEPAHAMADDSSGLRKGALETLNAKGTLTVSGQTLNFDPRRVRIFAPDGKAKSMGALQKGAKISFTLDPRDATRQRIGVIYLH